LNQCSACGADFTSVRLFDGHRIGVHEYESSPERPDGRRCLTLLEMQAKGWEKDARGRWLDPAKAQQTRGYFERAA
jgi:hypothetical protein